MDNMSTKKLPPVSIVIVHRNSSSTILHTLDGILKQTYPVKEVTIVDNISTDNSLEKIKKFAKIHPRLNIKILIQKENKGIGSSYNRGVKASLSEHVIIMQADGVLPTKHEIATIMKPVLNDKIGTVIATTPYTIMPTYVWKTYNFWEKCLVAPSVEKKVEGFNGKFDYVNKKFYLKAGGYDEKNFNAGIGAEDADLTMRLKKVGSIIRTNATVVHLHYLGSDYTLMKWILNRKLYARSYGKIIRMYGWRLPIDMWFLLIKPILAFSIFLPILFPYNVLVIIAFLFVYMERMYRTKETLFDYHILFLPFISFFLIYYETFWMIEAFLLPVVNSPKKL